MKIADAAILLSLSMLFSGLAMASMPQPETEETSQLSVDVAITLFPVTTTHYQQRVTQDESLSMVSRDGGNVATIGYEADLNAVNGPMIYTESLDLNTANQNAISENLEVQKQFQYVASPGGKLIFSEEVLMNDMGSGNLGDMVLCPLWHGDDGTMAYNEFVSAGTYMEMEQVAAVTNAGVRTIAESADTPVELYYNVHAGAQSLVPTAAAAGAVGYIEANVDVHSMDSRNWDGVGTPPLGNEVIYTQTTTASGVFDFRMATSYLSGVTLTGPSG